MSPEEQDLLLLRQTFQDFIATSSELENAYNRLKEESQNLSAYLGSILENMEDAILVVTGRETAVLWNGQACRYLPSLEKAEAPVQLKEIQKDAVLDLSAFFAGEADHRELSAQINGSAVELVLSRRPFYSVQKILLGQLLIIHDQTEIKRLEQRSRQEDRLRVMGELAAEMAHEIRNPLGSIELMVSLLEQDVAVESPNHALIGRLRSAVQIMNHTVSNVLLYTRDIQIKKRSVPLDQLVSQAETAILAHISRQEITLRRHLPEISLELDVELMQQALANLLLNAAQASPKGGTISIEGSKEGKVLKLTLSDEGPGISDDVRKKLFTPFFTTKNSGTGLGLAMVKRVLEAHNGQIECLDRKPGASFLIQLPLE